MSNVTFDLIRFTAFNHERLSWDFDCNRIEEGMVL